MRVREKIKLIVICSMVITCLSMFGISRERILAEMTNELNEDINDDEIISEMKLSEKAPVPVAYSIEANSSEEKKSKSVEKKGPHGYASVSVDGIVQGFSIVYVRVKSVNDTYQSESLLCSYNYRDLQNLNYIIHPKTEFDSKDAKGRNFCVYAQYDIGSRIASGTISGEMIP